MVPRSSREQAFGLLTLEHYNYQESLLIAKLAASKTNLLQLIPSHMASQVHTQDLQKSQLAAELSLTMRTMRKNLSPPVAIEVVNLVQRLARQTQLDSHSTF